MQIFTTVNLRVIDEKVWKQENLFSGLLQYPVFYFVSTSAPFSVISTMYSI